VLHTEISIVAPCFNEEDNVNHLIERISKAMTKANISFEIVLVNDGSTDNTWKVITECASRVSHLSGINNDKNLGIAESWKRGVSAAKGKYVCLIDADLQNLPEDIPRLYDELIGSHADIAQGARSSIDRNEGLRFFISRALNFALNVTFSDNASDNKSGFVLGPRHALMDALSYRGKYNHFQTFIRVSARSRGYSFCEVETLFTSRFAGESFLRGWKGILVSAQVFLDIPRALLEFGRGVGDSRDASLLPLVRHTNEFAHPYQGFRRVLFELYFATMPLHKWLIRRNARSIYLQLKQSEKFSKTEISELQIEKLNRLLHHAHTKVPFYRKRFIQGKFETRLNKLDDLESLPLLSKEDVRQNLYFDLFSSTHNKKEMHKISTSGSTGEPFTTYADRYQLEVRFATTLRALEWTGWRFGDKQARLWHQTLGMSRTQIARERIDSWFMRRLFIPAFDIKNENLDKFVSQIRKHNPVLVDGYAESLNFLATYVRSGKSAGFSPTAIMSSAQALPDNVRSIIEQGFNTRVYDKYGSREFSGIAYQCSASPDHHVMAESYIVELLVEGRKALPGEVGEIVITDLNNFSVPLIRYRIGDLAVAVDESKSCPCGNNFPRIGEIQGRTQAIVHCANGTWMPGTFFAHFFKDFEPVVRFFQIHQLEPNSFDLKIVKGTSWNESLFNQLLKDLSKYIGSETNVNVIYVDSIPLVRTGKRSPVVSEIPLDFQMVQQQSLGRGRG
jgi:phenylacetate-CoA ligase